MIINKLVDYKHILKIKQYNHRIIYHNKPKELVENELGEMVYISKPRIDKGQETLQESIIRTKRTIKDYALCTDFDYFATFTFARKNAKVDNTDLEKVYLSVRDFTKNYLQIKGIKYIICPEYHKDKKYIHLHALLKGQLDIVIARDHKTKKPLITSKGQQVYNIPKWTYGYNSCVKIEQGEIDHIKVSNYITKYVTKDLISKFNKNRYWCSQGLDKPRDLARLEIQDNDKMIWCYQDQIHFYKETSFYKESKEIDKNIIPLDLFTTMPIKVYSSNKLVKSTSIDKSLASAFLLFGSALKIDLEPKNESEVLPW